MKQSLNNSILLHKIVSQWTPIFRGRNLNIVDVDSKLKLAVICHVFVVGAVRGGTHKLKGAE